MYLKAAMLFVAIAANCSAASAQDAISPVNPVDFKISGIKLGDTSTSAIDQAKKLGLPIRNIMSQPSAGEASYMQGFIGEVASKSYDDEFLLVLLSRSGKVMQILHEKQYAPGHEITADALREGVLKQYGLIIKPFLAGQSFLTLHVDYDVEEKLVGVTQCSQGSNNRDISNLRSLLQHPLIGDMQIWTEAVDGCGISFDMAGFAANNKPDVITTVSQQLRDQAAVISDIKAGREKVSAELKRQNRETAHGLVGNKPQL